MLDDVGMMLESNLQNTETELIADLMERRGRGFSSDRECWAMLKEDIERAESLLKSTKKVHDTMWDSVKEKNGDEFNALCQELERNARIIAAQLVTAAANAKIGVL